MGNMTRQHYVWLAKEIGPMIKDSEKFIESVRSFNTNRNFCLTTFRNALEDAIADAQGSNDCGPDLYKLDDNIPY